MKEAAVVIFCCFLAAWGLMWLYSAHNEVERDPRPEYKKAFSIEEDFAAKWPQCVDVHYKYRYQCAIAHELRTLNQQHAQLSIL